LANDSPSSLRGFQRRFLRGLANRMDATILVRDDGLTDDLLRRVRRAVDDVELIKVRFVAGKERRKELARELAARAGVELIGVVGHVAILYRPHADPERRRIRLPDQPV